MTTILKVWRQIENPTSSIEAYIYLRNTPVEFHPDPIWNDEALGFFEDGRPNKKKKNNNKMSSDRYSSCCCCCCCCCCSSSSSSSSWGDRLQKSLRLRRFKSDRDEIRQECSLWFPEFLIQKSRSRAVLNFARFDFSPFRSPMYCSSFTGKKFVRSPEPKFSVFLLVHTS